MVYPGEALFPYVDEPGGTPAVASSPTALKRWIAIELRRLREESGHDLGRGRQADR